METRSVKQDKTYQGSSETHEASAFTLEMESFKIMVFLVQILNYPNFPGRVLIPH